VLPLIKTLFQILALRRGPDAIPRSWLLLSMSVALWVFSALAGLALIDRFNDTDFFLGLFSGLVGIACYSALVVFSGRGARLLQTVSAIIGCSALIFLAFVAEYVLFMPFLGATTTGFVATLILFWSVPVEGHIIARAIDRHWYIGIMIAVAVFCLQYVVNTAVTSS
jgi:hypothetical protein